MQFKYGEAPIVIAENIILDPTEMCFVQYLPISLIGHWVFIIPKNLEFVRELINLIRVNERLNLAEYYVYLTVKHMYVNNNSANRKGWHSDGFGTDDINYIWYDSHPTEFCIQDFNLSDDHSLSMVEMTEQAKEENIITYPCNSLIKMTQSSIHRVSDKPFEGMRTFVKISISKEKYNLKGNAHNYLFDYSWDMKDRTVERNHPIAK